MGDEDYATELLKICELLARTARDDHERARWLALADRLRGAASNDNCTAIAASGGAYIDPKAPPAGENMPTGPGR